MATFSIAFALPIGKVPPKVSLGGADGGFGDGKTWSSGTLSGKVHTVIYMDPDKRKDTMELIKELKKLKYPGSKYSTVAIINLAATWMPNKVLMSKLQGKQNEMKNSVYVFDKHKKMVKKWNLKDDASNVLVFDKRGRLLYQKSGRLSSSNINTIMAIIKKHI